MLISKKMNIGILLFMHTNTNKNAMICNKSKKNTIFNFSFPLDRSYCLSNLIYIGMEGFWWRKG